MKSIIRLSPQDGPACCAVCIYARKLDGLFELSCEKKGMVTPDFLCKKFSLDITAKTARRRRTPAKGGAQQYDFSI